MLLQVMPPSVLVCHWAVGVGAPFAPTKKFTSHGPAPDTVTSIGCAVTMGGDAVAKTVSVAWLLSAWGGTPL